MSEQVRMMDKVKLRGESAMKKVWFYIIWPPLVLNIGGLFLIAAIYAHRYATSPAPTAQTIQVSFSQLQFALSVFIFLVEWFFAGLLIYNYRISNGSVRSLFSRTANLLEFRWMPAILLFVLFNAVSIGYLLYLIARMPELSYRDLSPLQIGFIIFLAPLTAAFTEELIWRGHILSGLILNGKKPGAALLISATSFALIHGVFLPDKLVVTFLMGLLTGVYYLRERNLVPLIVTHWFVNVWAFGLFVFR
jgi:membrane protease YdiL (CAAX protease family)